MKVCNVCQQALPRAEFYANRKAADGLQSCCKPCRRHYLRVNRDRVLAVQAAYRRSRGVRERGPSLGDRLERLYGISSATYDALLQDQGGLCACCRRPSPDGRKLAVDHCHTTGTVRGLLCHRCNLAIGLLGDDVDGVRRALDYLLAPAEVDE